MSRPQSKYVRVDPSSPQAAGQCMRCGFWYPLRTLVAQDVWAGQKLFSAQLLVCTTGNRCYDFPNEQLRTIVLPPDPPPIPNARVPDFAYEENTVRVTQYSGPGEPPYGAGPQMLRCLQNGEQVRILQYLTSS